MPSRHTGSVTARWARRNTLAQERGYKNYYDYRAHNYGKTPSSAPRARGEQLAKLRGHRGRKSLFRTAGDGDVVNISSSSIRNNKGQFEWLDVTILSIDGKARTFRLSGEDMRRDRLQALLEQLESQGAVVTVIYPAELRGLSTLYSHSADGAA